ncbi:unnamed protein product [Rhizoctonia solani]|uniref:Myb-like domain-containing protein n=1 Tax=Rhizoctonia solani TaxID=456999 RepID=A0A8H2W758_9AGAM|nr:unnamed protein product [Rhizoctonia solani]
MEPIIEDNNVVNISTIDASIVDLDKFIQAQRSALCRIQDGTKSLEELKNQAIAHPRIVLGDIMAGEYHSLKFSKTGPEIDTDVPELDWTLFGVNDFQPAAHPRPPEISTSRIDKMRAHISEFRQALELASPLPPELLDDDGRDTEERDKKRRRLTSVCRTPATASSSGLRLPHLAEAYNNVKVPTSLVGIRQPPEFGHPPTSSPVASTRNSTSSPTTVSQIHMDHSHSQQRVRAPKRVEEEAQVRRESSSHGISMTLDIAPTTIQPDEDSPVAMAEEPVMEIPDSEGPSTFKQNWSLAEQHTLERLLVEIPSTVKFRWVRISEAMGGTRTPRQVASRVQKYYEKMKKLGVTVNSADMGGGGRGGSKATQTLNTPPSARSRNSSTRGKPKTGPQYTKSGRRR